MEARTLANTLRSSVDSLRLERLLRGGFVLLQLVLVLAVVSAYQLESRTLYHVAMLAVAGFAVHAVLPLQYRLRFFAALSFAAIGVAFGARDGLLLIAAGMVLIGICHLPVRFSVRVGLLVVAGGALAVSRAGLVTAPWSEAVWPILGSMFMFRLALYLHALKHDPTPPKASRTFAYFFMLPNVTFPLFPVVDYSTFARTHYDRDALEIYEKGLSWIVRGLLQLLAYRIVYLHVVPDARAVADLGDLLAFLLGTFLLYLRVSGGFHLIVGLLYLFGFRLPETHHLYYLASSFTDFWRRINIYWKDFMMKLVYYPSFFRLRRRGPTFALVASTLIVFLATWLLHSYQWFWLRGGFPLEAQDALFWSILGTLVVVTSLREMRRPRSRSLSPRGWNAGLALRTMSTFVVLCVLWSLWSTDSVIQWLWLWRAALVADAADLLLLAGLLGGGLLVTGWTWGTRGGETPAAGTDAVASRPVLPLALRPALPLLALLLLASPRLYEAQAPQLAGFVASVREPTLNAADAALQHRGYYEKLDNPGRMSAQLWSTVAQRPANWPGARDAGVLRNRRDFLGWELAPSARGAWNDVPVTINEWGMRDRSYTLAKPAGTYRIALLGQSHTMGTYVRDEEAFQHVLEETLNAAAPAGIRYEVLNFGVTDYALTQQVALLESRVLQFSPDVVILTFASTGVERVVNHLLSVAYAGVPIPFPELEKMLEDAGLGDVARHGVPVPFASLRAVARALGIEARIPYDEAEARIRWLAGDLNVWAVRRAHESIRAHGAVPVVMTLNTVGDRPEGRMPQVTAAREAGFIVFDLFDLFEGRDQAALKVAPWDTHPNAQGHRLIAQELHAELLRAGLVEGGLTRSEPSAHE